MTDKQKAFVEHYLQCWNATEAALQAGYSERSARSIGHENLTKPDVSAEIERRIEEMVMTADEAMICLSNQARASFGEMIKLVDGQPVIDWQRIITTGAIDSIKEIIYRGDSITIRLHDSQAALVQILKQRRLTDGEPTERFAVSLEDKRKDLERRLTRIATGRGKTGVHAESYGPNGKKK